MAYKIYGKGNYLFIDDTITGLRHEQLKKNVFVQKEATSATLYKIDPVHNIGGIRLELVSTDILKENGTPYTDAEWVTFYTENTGNFNGGAGGSQTTVVENYAALPLPSAAVDEFYFLKNSQGTKWLPGSLGGTYYSNGLYYSDGIEWFYTNLPYQATQAQVNLGANTTEFLTPYTFDNSNKILNSFQKNIDDTDDITEGFVNLFMTQAEKDSINFPPDFLYETIKIVQTIADFPTPIGNEIFLVDNTIYFIDNGDLDISGYTLVFAQRSQINGFGQNVSKISSTTAGTLANPYVFFKSETNLFMNDLEIECKGNYQLIWEHIGNGTVPEGESFELNRFNVLNEQAPNHGCQLGYISNIRQGFVGTFSCFNFENGFKLGGSWTGGFRVDNTIFINCSGKFFYSDPLNPVTFARRFASNANITVPLFSIGYDFPSTAFSFSGQYQLQNGNATGAGTYVSNFASGFPAYDALANFQNNTGIQNTFAGGEWIVTANTTIAVAAQNVYYNIVVPTIERGLTWFSETTGEFLYLSNTPLDVQITLTVTLTGTANNLIEIQLIKEDSGMVITPLLSKIITLQGTLAQGRAESAVITTTAQLVFGDKIRARGRNTSAAQNFTVSLDCNCIINAK